MQLQKTANQTKPNWQSSFFIGLVALNLTGSQLQSLVLNIYIKLMKTSCSQLQPV